MAAIGQMPAPILQGPAPSGCWCAGTRTTLLMERMPAEPSIRQRMAIVVITIKKATVADHGTETGWVKTHGEGQAVFNSIVTFSTDDWVLDGSTRDESNPPLSWFNTTSYGFKITNNSNAAQVQLKFGAGIDNFTMRYVWIQGRTGRV